MKAKSKASKSSSQPVGSTPRKSVEIEKAKNGFVISQWGDEGKTTFIAKTEKEAKLTAAKLLKI